MTNTRRQMHPIIDPDVPGSPLVCPVCDQDVEAAGCVVQPLYVTEPFRTYNTNAVQCAKITDPDEHQRRLDEWHRWDETMRMREDS